MGRGVREATLISDEHTRRLTYKKRRIGLLKKCMQLSLISDCDIQMKIFWKEDGSLVEYESTNSLDFRKAATCDQHVKILNDNFKLIEILEAQTIKHGHMFDDNDELATRLYTELDGVNLLQLFNLGNGKGSKKDTMKKS